MADSESQHLFEKACRLMPGGVNSPVRAFRSVGGAPFFTRQAKGPFLKTVDGQELIDFVCTWGPAIHGHQPPEITAALEKALHRGTSFGTPGPDEVTMAETLTRMVPSLEQVRMCNSGTEATMSCLRLARGFTGRDLIIKFAGCYHGHVDSLLVQAGSGALTLGHPDSAGIPRSLAELTLVLPYNDPAALEKAFAEHGERIAGLIVESYPANVGFILPEPGFLQTMQKLCRQHGAVFIFDEVMTGFRLAPGGVQELEGITPDLTAMGKIIGGGLPVGAFGGRREIMQYLAPVGPVYQAGTLSGNPLAMAAGLASLQKLQEEQPYATLEKVGKTLADSLRSTCKEKGLPAQIIQKGSMFCLFFNEQPIRDGQTAQASDRDLYGKWFHHCLDNGVYLPPSPFETCFISTAHSPEVMGKATEIMCDCLKKL